MNCTVYSLFQFSYLHAFYKSNNITKLNLKLNLIFKVSQTKRQIKNIPLWIHMWHKEWREDGKNFIWCCTIALKFWDEFNVNFVLLYFSSYRSIEIWHLYFKNAKKKAVRQCIKTPKHFQYKRFGWESCMVNSKDWRNKM